MNPKLLFAISTTFLLGLGVYFVWPKSLDADIYPDGQILVDGATRKFRLVVPRRLRQPTPLVFAFHGVGDTPQSMADYSELDLKAAQEGFILVYPAAENSMWKTVDADPATLAANADVKYFQRLLQQLGSQYDIDPDCACLMGMSNGATFVQLLASACPDQVAAIVAHSGTRPKKLVAQQSTIPLMMIVGDKDPAAETMRANATKYRADGTTVELRVVAGLGHQWSTKHNREMIRFLLQCCDSDR